MTIGLLSRLGLGRDRGRVISQSVSGVSRFRPGLEGLEDRITPAAIDLPLDVTDVSVVGEEGAEQLAAAISIAGQEAGTALISATAQEVEGEECPVLSLEVGAIHLDLLGLQVDTSDICLDVTAVDDQGLLGSLLCDLGEGLDLGELLDLGGILDQLGDQVDDLLGRLEDLLDQVLSQSMTVTDVFGMPVNGGPAAEPEEGVCDILNLSLGPVDLEVPLLGVNVALDNCADPPGPITVDVTADPTGGLLGSLLCGLADGLDLGDLDLNQLLGRVDRLIDQLGDLAGRLDQLPDLADRLEDLTDRLEQIFEQVDDLRGLDRVIGGLEKVVDRLDKIIDRLDDPKHLDKAFDHLEKVIDHLGKALRLLP